MNNLGIELSEALASFDLPDYIKRTYPGCELKKTGNGYRCAAVWRDGDSPGNVSLSRGKDGAWLFKDFVSEVGGNAINFLKIAQGMSTKEAADLVCGVHSKVVPMAPKSRSPERLKTSSQSWVYKDEHGNPVSRTVRCDYSAKPYKGYFQESADDKGHWRRGEGAMDGVRRVPYRLPEVLAAETVYVPEGEKCVDRLFKEGLTATCNAEGAGKWKQDHARHLAGKHVIVIPDEDVPGRQHARSVAQSLIGVAASVKIVVIPGLKEKDDVCDWLESGRTKDELLELVAQAQEITDSHAIDLILPPPIKPLTADTSDGDGEGVLKKAHLQANDTVRANLDSVSEMLQVMQDEIGSIYRESFSGKVRVTPGPILGGADRPLGSIEALQLTRYLQREHKMARVSDELVYKAAMLVAHENQHDALTDWLDKLCWDGVDRLATWLVTAYGVDDTHYTRCVGWNWLISMVARAYKPGAKVDTMPILEGAQGIGKSRSLQALVPVDWYVDREFRPDDKDFLLAIQGRWLIENGELHGLGKSAQEAIKQFLSCRSDVVRPPYERAPVDMPRRCVMVGTTNESEYLSDPTGARRFWPIKCHHADVGWIEAHRDQLWAEAVRLYKDGAEWWQMPAEAKSEQEARRAAHPWEVPVLRWLNDAGRIARKEFSPDEILREAVQMPIDRQDKRAAEALTNILAPQGWTRRRDRVDKSPRINWWCRPQS